MSAFPERYGQAEQIMRQKDRESCKESATVHRRSRTDKQYCDHPYPIPDTTEHFEPRQC